ncbi:MAG TPA: hypothetical protein VK982_07450, partial [Bacteroidales bacterium]|nr:hypothetical protein [Bacteroidales bacterium]
MIIIADKINTNEKDEQKEELQELEKQFYKLDFSQLARAVVQDLDTGNGSNIMFRSFPKDRVVDALQNPQRNEKTLRDLSNFLYILSPHYRRLCNYHAEMPTLDYYIEPYKLDIQKVNEKQFRKAYNETLFELDNMNIKHEMLKALQITYREGIFYGYEYKTEDSYFIQKLNPDYCRISTIEDGVYNYEFNFQYFEMDEEKLENYAPEFTTKYNLYKNSRKSRKKGEDLQWQELDSENTICLKTDEAILYPFPPFAGVFGEIYEIEDYKALKKANNEMQNIAILGGAIPINDKSDTANDFKITLDTAIEFGNKINTELPDQVGFILSVFDDMKLFKLSDDKVGTDKVQEAVNNFWNSTGVSKNLFTDGGTTDAAIKASLITDEQSVFVMLRQIERWLNRKLKFNGNKYKFKLNILDVTHQNRDRKIAEELKSAQFGTPNKIKLYTTMGGSQASMSGMAFLENTILELHDEWIPLKSSHTSSDTNSP